MKSLADFYHMDETACVQHLLGALNFSAHQEQQAGELATAFIKNIRDNIKTAAGVEQLIAYYDLSTQEGIMLMSIAEALLRIPDSETQDQLIRAKLNCADWRAHLGKSHSVFVNAVTRALSLSEKVLNMETSVAGFKKIWRQAVHRWGEPLIRKAIHQAVKLMADQFVVGKDLKQAIKASRIREKKGYVYSYDMLGEVARTQADADRYYRAYEQAIAALAQKSLHSQDMIHGPGISVKLSALHPRYQFTQRERAAPFLIEKLRQLAHQAREANLCLTLDAEEADRLDISLEIFAAVFSLAEFKDWNGLGLAVQSYQKRALPLIDELILLARRHQKRISVRLVKGAYWDTEIKLAQWGGYRDYPVFTRKITTDLSFLVCAQRMLTAQDAIYPQFATHNAYSAAAILTMMQDPNAYDFEFQRLQGMGEALHDQLVRRGCLSRIYAPVGNHHDLLPYLVRRLLENGSNNSFVNQIANPHIALEKLAASPLSQLRAAPSFRNPRIPLPQDLFADQRVNSQGLDVSDLNDWLPLSQAIDKFKAQLWRATPLSKPIIPALAQICANPADRTKVLGHVVPASREEVEMALQNAQASFELWNEKSVADRGQIILRAADLLEQHRAELIYLMAVEAGKTLGPAIAELREAVDFCRYYTAMAIKQMPSQLLTSPTGESNSLRLSGRGPVVSISPWNFPVSIFTGQMCAALITGNTVIAKPAEQTPLVAQRIVELFHQAGIPSTVLQLLPGSGETVGAALVEDIRTQAVIFTGSTATAKLIQRNLAERPGVIIPLIAETGGINAMVVDSSALPEQVINEVMTSAFDCAGQRCSALRVLFLQNEIADKMLEMLRGAMQEMVVGDPLMLSTDVGPVIDASARQMLQQHCEKMSATAKLVAKAPLKSELSEHGFFITPQVFEIADTNLIEKEVFGPILHVVRYAAENLAQVVTTINGWGYGLTFGIQSRVDSTIDYLQKHIQAGNIYVNRTMIGAVVGVQPFGGHRLSGTGPKAGGPHYLARLCTETCLSVNTTASGGNTQLMTLEE